MLCRLAFFGVFDGHGGRHVAQYAADNLHATVMAAGLAAEVGPALHGVQCTVSCTIFAVPCLVKLDLTKLQSNILQERTSLQAGAPVNKACAMLLTISVPGCPGPAG